MFSKDEHATRYPGITPLSHESDQQIKQEVAKMLHEVEEAHERDLLRDAISKAESLPNTPEVPTQYAYSGPVHHVGTFTVDGKKYDAWAPAASGITSPLGQRPFEEFVRTGKVTTVTANTSSPKMPPEEPYEDEYASERAVPEYGNQTFLALLGQIADMHHKKSAGYAGGRTDTWSNFRECEDFGVDAFTGVIVRMADKWSRIKSLKRNAAHDQIGESMRDTLMDMASYALIAICLLDEQQQE